MVSPLPEDGKMAACVKPSNSHTASNGVPGGDATMASRKEKDLNERRSQDAAFADRQIVLVHNREEENADEDDEYTFEDDEEATQMHPRWMAIARYYSGKAYSTWALFSELSSLWGKKEPIHVRELGDNRFIVEFDSEKLW